MSWSFWMEADLGGPERVQVGDSISMTYNVSPMYYEALEGMLKSTALPVDDTEDPGIRGLDGRKGSEVALILKMAIERMKGNPDKYKAMNPPNGWGDYQSALNTLETLFDWATRSPNAYFVVE